MADAVTMQGIVKRYPGVLANDHVNLSVQTGEIRAIVGENGAGKSTLMKILYGLESPDAGHIQIRGDAVRIRSSRDAIALGIGMVHQHFRLVPSFTVAQNVVLGVEPHNGWALDTVRMRREVIELSKRYGLHVDPERSIRDVSVGEQQRTEILRALYRKAEVLILDEPTAVLTDSETDELFAILRRLAADGLTILFISHKLREVLAVSDNTTVMRAGKVVGTVATGCTTARELAEMMIGRSALEDRPRERSRVEPGPPVLQIANLSAYDSRGVLAVRAVSLQVGEGEVVGIAGVEGNGQVELAEAITGLRTVAEGRISIRNREIQNQPVRTIRECGVAHIPADRNDMGVALDAKVWESLFCTHYYQDVYSNRTGLAMDSILSTVAQRIADFDVRTPSLTCPTKNLSGGNVQKLVVARELGDRRAHLVVASQPTRGIDIAGTEAIRSMLLDYAAQGAGVLLISADLDEVLALSDRVAVMYGGRLIDIGPVGEDTRQEVGRAMTGGQTAPGTVET